MDVARGLQVEDVCLGRREIHRPRNVGLEPENPASPIDEHELRWAPFLTQAIICADNRFQKLLLTTFKDHVTDLDTLTGSRAVKGPPMGHEHSLRPGDPRAGATDGETVHHLPMAPDDLIPEQDRKLYLGLLEDMYRRIEQARTFLQPGPKQPALESAALQLRIVIELIVMASLVSNRANVEEITTALADKSVDAARKLARNANPDYWPKADRAHDAPGKTRQLLPIDGALTEDRWNREWGMLSDLLHARNPFAPQLDVPAAHAKLTRLTGEAITLLTHHVLKLADDKGLLVGQIDPDGKVSVVELVPAGSAQAVAAVGNRKERRAAARAKGRK